MKHFNFISVIIYIKKFYIGSLENLKKNGTHFWHGAVSQKEHVKPMSNYISESHGFDVLFSHSEVLQNMCNLDKVHIAVPTLMREV